MQNITYKDSPPAIVEIIGKVLNPPTVESVETKKERAFTFRVSKPEYPKMPKESTVLLLENQIISYSEVLMSEDLDRFDSVVRRLLTMLSGGQYDLTATGTKLRPYGLAKGKVKIPEAFYDPLTDEEIALFEGE